MLLSTGSDMWAISGWVVGVVGLLVALLAWLRPRAVTRRLGWWSETEEVVHEDFGGGISITVDGDTVTTLSQTRVSLVNRGGEAILGEELLATSSTPEGNLCLELSGATKVLRCRFPQSVPSHILPLAELDGATCLLTWQILEPGDSLELALIHAGEGSTSASLTGHVANGRIKNIQVERDDFMRTTLGIIVDSLPLVGTFRTVGAALLLVRRLQLPPGD
jgi:hypothetical protein